MERFEIEPAEEIEQLRKCEELARDRVALAQKDLLKTYALYVVRRDEYLAKAFGTLYPKYKLSIEIQSNRVRVDISE